MLCSLYQVRNAYTLLNRVLFWVSLSCSPLLPRILDVLILLYPSLLRTFAHIVKWMYVFSLAFFIYIEPVRWKIADRDLNFLSQ